LVDDIQDIIHKKVTPADDHAWPGIWQGGRCAFHVSFSWNLQVFLIWNKYCRSSPHWYISTLARTIVQSRFPPREVLRRRGTRSKADCTYSVIFLPLSMMRRIPGVSCHYLLPPPLSSLGENVTQIHPQPLQLATVHTLKSVKPVVSAPKLTITRKFVGLGAWATDEESHMTDFINEEDLRLLTETTIIWAICQHISKRVPHELMTEKIQSLNQYNVVAPILPFSQPSLHPPSSANEENHYLTSSHQRYYKNSRIRREKSTKIKK